MVINVTCRDGVSDSQFNQVLNIELDQIMQVWIMVCLFSVWSTFYGLDLFSWGYIIRHASLLKKIGNQSSQWSLPRRTITPSSSKIEALKMFFQVRIHLTWAWFSFGHCGLKWVETCCRNNSWQQDLSPTQQWLLSLCPCWIDCK